MWIEKDFNLLTEAKANGEWCVLLMDGHNSHHTPELLRYALDHKIIILGYPPHCTHALQGLDVVCFAHMKEAWKKAISRFEETHARDVRKGDFVEVFWEAFQEAFTKPTIRSAFEATGIFPFNPKVITEQQMKPSTVTSTQATFPLPMPTPVRCVMKIFHSQPTTAFDRDSDHFQSPASSLIPAGGSVSGPQTPTCPSGLSASNTLASNVTISPTVGGRLLTGALAASTSSSFLVGSERITSTQTIPPPIYQHVPDNLDPDWSAIKKPSSSSKGMTVAQMKDEISQLTRMLEQSWIAHTAKNDIIAAQNAQLTIQDVYLGGLNKALNTKENEKLAEKRTLFPGGKGRHLTEPEFIESREQAAQEKLDKDAERVKRSEKREKRKEIPEEIAKLYEARIKAWEVEVASHSTLCAELKKAGTKVKDLPKKPKKPLKKDAEKEVKARYESDEEEEELEGSDDEEFDG